MNEENKLIKRWIFDIECYPNLFLLCAKNVVTKERRIFQVSPLGDDRPAFIEWFNNEVEEMVGFNNIFYDYPVLHHALMVLWNMKGRDFCSRLFKFSDGLIKGTKKSFLKDNQHFRKQIDLFKINHFDNKAKTASLKLLEFNLKMKNIQELPFPVGTVLEDWQIKEIIKYCDNDVDATELVYDVTLPAIELREVLSPKYQIDFTNYNDVKIGEHIFISKIIKKAGEHLVYDRIETDRGIRKVVKNTIRESININEIILPFITFREEPFDKILQWFKTKTIKDLNGVFSEIPFEDLKILEPHYRVIKKNGKQRTLNVMYNDFQYDFGVGGIHGCIKPGIYIPLNDELIIDLDVEGYYPSESIQFKFEPAHLKGVYSEVHQEIKSERKLYPKKTPENTSLKLAGNGTYGKGGSEYSPLCDKQYVVQTCVNGQLLLCMLIETIQIEMNHTKILQANTDGFTLVLKKKDLEQLRTIYHRWEKLTGLVMEEACYTKMIISNVNNYIGVYDNGSVKRKGLYEYKLELHKNFSMLIVPKLLEKYFVDAVKPEEAIMNHDNIYDFFKRTKISRADKLHGRVYDHLGNIVSEEDEQRITRYYISGSMKKNKETKQYDIEGTGVTLIKEMPPLDPKITKKLLAAYDKAVDEEDYEGTLDDFRILSSKIRYSNIESEYLCTVCNDLDKTTEEFIRSNIHYQYYIDEVYKIINQIENE